MELINVENIKSWMDYNKSSLTLDKTELMLFANK